MEYDSNKLTRHNVEDTFVKCLRNSGPVTEGIIKKAYMQVDDEQSDRIKGMLMQLDDKFRADGGSGASFLEMCINKDGEQWGEHTDMEKLTMLGIAAGYAKFCFGRELWPILPGGMPYIVLDGLS